MNQHSSGPSPFDPQELTQLELATHNQPGSDAQLDPQTAALREGYLAFAQLLQAPAEPRLTTLVAVQPARRRSAWPVAYAVGGTLAAALLVALFLSKNGQPEADPTPVDPQPVQAVVVPREMSPQIAAPLPSPAPSSESLVWDDSLDEAIQQTGARLAVFNQQAAVIDSGLNAVDGRLWQIGNELQSGSL